MNMQVAKKSDSVVPEPMNELAAVLSMVARAAADPNVDIDKLERLMLMRERELERQSRTAFDDAMAVMQPELPSISERGDAAGRYTFAKWEDIQAAIKPVLQRHGFALTFRTDTNDKITVTGILSHRGGHREETAITLPTDPSGNKNAVQAVASSVAYGKRYTAGALLNLTSHGEDDDAFSAGVATITEEQEAELRELAEASGADVPAFLKYMKAGALSAIAAKDYHKAKAALNAKLRDRAK
jgi:hypothetical protein